MGPARQNLRPRGKIAYLFPNPVFWQAAFSLWRKGTVVKRPFRPGKNLHRTMQEWNSAL